MIAIIPDVHGRNFWKNITSNEEIAKYEKIIFLGDYLDPYGYEMITKQAAIDNFNEIIQFKLDNMDKVILLLGNHDLPYIFKEFDTKSRFDTTNAYKISSIFHKNYQLFKLVDEELLNDKRYLFSHAGLMNSWASRYKHLLPSIDVNHINSLLMTKEGVKSLCDVSFIRGGYDSTGSIVWSDVYEKLTDAQDAMNDMYDYQIFGHSQQERYPIINDNWACLDCRQIFVIDDENKISAL